MYPVKTMIAKIEDAINGHQEDMDVKELDKSARVGMKDLKG